MIGDGIIVESIASFKITWKNPGNGMQAVWDQENQVIELHESDVYPDLDFVSASGLSTYFTYSTADKIIGLLKRINEVINIELTELYKSKDQANEAVEENELVEKQVEQLVALIDYSNGFHMKHKMTAHFVLAFHSCYKT